MVNEIIVPSGKEQMVNVSSSFIVPTDFSSEWRDISLLVERTHTRVYVASRYGRRFLLKALTPEEAQLTDFRLQQEQEFQLGIQLIHPNIAATYSLEDINGVGRCIVQEWIDGTTLGEWLQTKPSKSARERVWIQLLDALEYLHGIQLVHHDLKADNILISRNGANVKLIDFGLSALDSTLSPVANNPQQDIQAVGRLLPLLLPHRRALARQCINGHFANISALRKAYYRRTQLARWLPIGLSVALLIAALIIFYLSWHERYKEQQRFEAMITTVDEMMAQERECLVELVNRPVTFDHNKAEDMMAYRDYVNEFVAFRQRRWAIRDSLADTYAPNDPLRDMFISRWNQKEAEIDKEFAPQLYGKWK